MKIAMFGGDGIGPEVLREARRVLESLRLPGLTLHEGHVGMDAYRKHGTPLPDETLTVARECDAVLFGAVGDPEGDGLPRDKRPERALLGLRADLELFANLRPAKTAGALIDASPLKPELAGAIDLLIVRELNGDVYFGKKAIDTRADGEREGWDRMAYAAPEVRRIAHVAFRAARGRSGRLTSVDKANVLETSQLWREVVLDVAKEYPDVTLDHLLVDAAAMELVRDPGQFDTIVTGNLFGDILSDQASACVGSIGLLPSASLGARQTGHGTFGMYEPIHGSAPDIAGRGIANPLAMILSAAMMLRHSFGREAEAARIEAAVDAALADGVRGADLGGDASTQDIGTAVIERL